MERPLRLARGSPDYLADGWTIVAPASAVGGALTVVRLSGEGTSDILARLTNRPVGSPRRMVLRKLFGSAGETLDEALVCRFDGKASFTGEDSAELFLHGGAFVASQVIDRVFELGARPALRGEFSFRAVKNGRMNVLQAQAVKDLIDSSSTQARALALEKLSGAQNQWIEQLGEGLRQLVSLGELGIDFSDQEVEELSLHRLKVGAQEIKDLLSRLAASFERGRRIQGGVSVAFVGLPNAGKSSLFNALLGEERSIVSEFAGTTRDVVRETLTLEGSDGESVLFRVSDTAGLRSTEDVVERQGIERTLRAAEEADLVVWVIAKQTTPGELRTLTRHMEKMGHKGKHLIICSQVDRGGADEIDFRESIRCLGGAPVVETSTATGVGISKAAAQMVSLVAGWIARDPGELVLTQQLQQRAVVDAVSDLERALAAPEYEFFASDIRQAMRSLSPLIGETPTEEILGRIFSQFCIGK